MTTVAATCVCGSIGRTDLRQCPEHFHLWNGDVRLASVGSVCKLYPQKPCSCGSTSYDGHAPGCPVKDKIDNAQARGKEVDTWFSAWVRGEVTKIPVGDIRQDSAALLVKLVTWFRKQKFVRVESQVVVGNNEIGGVLDLRCDGHIFELKCVYSIATTHILQAAGYAAIENTTASILHLAERFDEPREIKLQPADYDNWTVLLNYWRMVKTYERN